LEEVTPKTFNRFLEWAYQGFYSAPHPKTVETSPLTSLDTSAQGKPTRGEIERSVSESVPEAIEVVNREIPVDEPN
jgi:hypothetical protein